MSKLKPMAWARNIAAMASYKIMPSLFKLVPIKADKRAERSETPMFSVKHRKVTGTVAKLLFVEKPIKIASMPCPK